MEYIKEIFDNYNKLSIEDKKQLSERIIKIQDDDRSGEFYFSRYYDLDSIDRFLDLIINAKNNLKHFEKFYNMLNDKQKKEFQTRTYLFADNMDVPSDKLYLYKKIADLVIPKADNLSEKKDVFTIDFERLEIALEEINYYDMSERVVAIYQNIANIEKTNQVPYEIIEMIQKCLSIIKENVNDSTRNKVESLSLDRQVMIVLLLLDVNKTQLDKGIEYRKKLREERDDFYRKKRANGIKEKLDSSKKIIKTKSNKKAVYMKQSKLVLYSSIYHCNRRNA